MRKYVVMIITAGLCGSAVADLVTNATFAAFTSEVSALGVADDVFQNASVTADSGAHATTDIQDLFTQGSPVVQNLILFKDVDADSLSYVEFNTAVSYSLTNITIGLGNDYKSSDPDVRSIENVKIYARTSDGVFTAQDLIADIDVDPEYTDAYGQRFLSLSIDLPSVAAQYFRAEFTEPLGDGYLDRGARVYEIDGYATIPEPATLSLFVIVGGGLLLVRRMVLT
jgi:hypothetical protein